MDKAIEKAIIETANPALAPGKSKPANAAANRKIPFLQDNAPAGDAPQSKPLKDVLYEQITSVIGGDNPNQFFSMSLPGTLLDAAQYTYNVDGNQPKPAEVEANESKLANKLFDPCKIGAADSGRLLQNQYKTALEMLTPRLNGKLFDAKTKLRRVLMTPYPYNFGDGSKDVLTIEQVFYRLYEEYVSEKLAWAKEQLAKKNALAAKYPDNTAIDYAERDNEYLNWYETVAEARTLAVAEKFGKVLNVFSPGDMDVIAAILNSGAGREVAQASQALDNVQKMNPDGSYVYPVTLYPQNWFNLLDTSFTTIDLLQSPAALSQRLAVLSGQRSSISNNINALMAMIPDEKTVTDFKEAKDKAETDSAAAVAKLSADGVKVTGDILNQALDIMNAGGITGKDAGTNEKGASLLSRVIGGITPDMVNKLIDDTAELQTDRQNRKSFFLFS